MAYCRIEVKKLSRLSRTSPPGNTLAYINREQGYAPAQASMDYIMRAGHRVQQREDLVEKGAGNLPEWAATAATFFAKAEVYKRANGRLATSWIVTLPRELSQAQNSALVRDFLTTQLRDHPYAYAIHESLASDGQLNPHVHVLFSERTNDGISRTAAQYFARANRDHPEHGGAAKERFFSERRAIGRIKESFCDLANVHLEQAGVAARLAPESLKARGVEREAEPRLPPSHSTKSKYRGVNTPAWQQVLDARQARDRQHEHEQARAQWEQRKAQLGITDIHTLDKEQFLQQMYARTREGQPGRYQTLEQLQAERDASAATLQTLDRHQKALTTELAVLEARERMGREVPAGAYARINMLLHEGLAMGLEEGNTQGHGIQFHARGKRKEQGLDLSP